MCRFLTTFKVTSTINTSVSVTTGNIGIFEESSSKTMGWFSVECYEEFIQSNQIKLSEEASFTFTTVSVIRVPYEID
jgi:hypothetical protein